MRGIITAGIRIAMIIVFLLVLQNVFNNSYAAWANNDQQLSADIYYLAGAFLIVSFILWIIFWKAKSIANILAGNNDDTSIVITTTNRDLFRVALRILGICLIFTAIPGIFGLIAYHIRMIDLSPLGIATSVETQAYEIRQWVTEVFKLIVGFGLVIGINDIKKMFKSVGDFINKPDTDEDKVN